MGTVRVVLSESKVQVRSKGIESAIQFTGLSSMALRNKIAQNIEVIKEDIELLVIEKIIGKCQAYDTRQSVEFEVVFYI